MKICGVQTQRCVRRNPWQSIGRSAATYPSLNIADVDLKLWDIVGRNVVLEKKSWHVEGLGTQKSAKDVAMCQEDLEARNMRDSFCEGYVRLGSDLKVRTKFMNIFGGVRFGRLLESMDVMAGFASYRHCCSHHAVDNPMGIVTALVDRIDMHEKIAIDRDVRLSAFVSWVGRSSMEVKITLDQEWPGKSSWTHLADATFVMVARSALTDRAHPVNGMVLSSDAREEKIFERGAESRVRRQKMSQEALTRKPPTEEERFVIHDLFLQTVDERSGPNIEQYNKPNSASWMNETRMTSTRICHPQHRNIHNKIFGGYLMRQAFELAWANACMFSKTRPRFIALDDTWFRCPVEIGSILSFSSLVTYTAPEQNGYFQVAVSAEVLDPATQSKNTSNVFHFTFHSDKPVPLVFPKSYVEAMRYLHGQRGYNRAMERNSNADNESLVHSLLDSWREEA